MKPEEIAVLLAVGAIILAAISIIIAIVSKPKAPNAEFLELEDGDLVVIDDKKVVVAKCGAIAVEKDITKSGSNQGDTTVTFKAGRKVQKIRIL